MLWLSRSREFDLAPPHARLWDTCPTQVSSERGTLCRIVLPCILLKKDGRVNLQLMQKNGESIVRIVQVSVISLAFILTGCSDASAATDAVRKSLKDPESAEFGAFDISIEKDNKKWACLTVNARNSFGGYTGDQEAMLTQENGKWEVVSTVDWSHSQCLEAAKKYA